MVSSSAEVDVFSETLLPVFRTHCVQCHGGGHEIEADVNLLSLRREVLENDIELVRRLISVLDQQEMPPEGEPQLDPTIREKVLLELKTIRSRLVADQKRLPTTPMRRMNRFQYNNSVQDLFELKCIVFTLPERMMREHKGYFQPATGKMADVVTVGSRPLGKSQMIESRLAGVAAFPQDLRAEHGFDNRGDHLTLSPLLMESFLKLGESITQSPDFGPQNVGLWKAFFESPAGEFDLEVEVRLRLEPFLTRAFRRTVSGDVLNRYAEFAMKQVEDGVAFTEAMKSVAAAAISSPKFLYLYDTTDAGHAGEQVNDFELASRLSFFLWGSIPDRELLDLATVGELSRPAVLNDQFERMLTDRKLKRFCDSFPSQWLQLDRIISSTPNREKYPGFYFLKYRDSMHMMLEPLLLFETVLIENLPITQFVDSDFTYRSVLLQEAYGELGNDDVDAMKRGGAGVTVLNFYRIPVTDRRNGGLVTNAAVMTMTSGPDRTQPITRGAWLAGVIFNNPPEPPPADVPPLAEKPQEGEEQLTLRERLTMHRQRSDCKGCHEQIDPLGFALENYDPIGVWRENYDNGRGIDMTGTLYRKHEFADIGEFKDAILAEKHRFTRALGGHLMAFALARELGAADDVALDEVVKATANDEYRFQTLLKQVVLSEPFRRGNSAMDNDEGAP